MFRSLSLNAKICCLVAMGIEFQALLFGGIFLIKYTGSSYAQCNAATVSKLKPPKIRPIAKGGIIKR